MAAEKIGEIDHAMIAWLEAMTEEIESLVIPLQDDFLNPFMLKDVIKQCPQH